MLVETIDGRNLSLRLLTHEVEPLDVSVGFHTNKVVFNVISSPKYRIINGLSSFVLHNP
jgi:hypothetical protein